MAKTSMKVRTRWGRRVLLVAMVFTTTVVATGVNVRRDVVVEGISLACQNSADCLEAVARESEATANAAAASKTANLFQMKVSELSTQIVNTEKEIAMTSLKVRELQEEITVIEKKLSDEQEALAKLLVNMHFESDAEPITVLAGAVSISDLAERQSRNEVVKQQISATAAKVRRAKEQLEADKAEVEVLLEEQKMAKANLEATRAEQQALVEKYQNDVVAYEKIAQAALEAQRAAEQAEKEAHPERYGGSAYSGDDTYPWQADCPGMQDAYGTVINETIVGGLVCECVSYVGWKAYEQYGVLLAWGNAYSWDDVAKAYGYRVDHKPEAGSIGQMDSGVYGHVWWVESINADGSVNVTEYNNPYATQLYSGVYQAGDFGARTMSAEDAAQYNYIHLK